MRNNWFFSDPHLSHEKFLTFHDDMGHPIRPFKDIDEMDEHIIEQWNSVVRDGDNAYMMGDITFELGERFDGIMARMKGRKRLILGNHDDPKNPDLMKHFKKAMIWRVFGEYNFVVSHIPIAKECFHRTTAFNLHGHTHVRELSDRAYINNCCELTNYRPRHLDEVLQIIKDRS